MPDRIIRERACGSPTLRELSDAAERAFWRATVRCDDYGRFDADPEVLLSRCFEKRPAGWTVARMRKILDEWDAVGLAHHYETGNGHLYGHFVTFLDHQRERDSKPKFPDPPCGDSPQDAAKCRDSRQVAARARETVRPSADESREARAESDARERPMAALASDPPGFSIPGSVLTALTRTATLGRVPRLRSPEVWQALIRAFPEVDHAAELLKAESWLAANPRRAPKKDLVRFVRNWFERAAEREA